MYENILNKNLFSLQNFSLFFTLRHTYSYWICLNEELYQLKIYNVFEIQMSYFIRQKKKINSCRHDMKYSEVILPFPKKLFFERDKRNICIILFFVFHTRGIA